MFDIDIELIQCHVTGGRRLLADEAFCMDLLSRVAKTGAAIEDALGSAQDVEGCVEADGSIFVVQTRPQM